MTLSMISVFLYCKFLKFPMDQNVGQRARSLLAPGPFLIKPKYWTSRKYPIRITILLIFSYFRTYKNLEKRVIVECDGETIPLPSLQGTIYILRQHILDLF